MKSTLIRSAVLAVAASLALTLSACGSDDTAADSAASDRGPSTSSSAPATSTGSSTTTASEEPFGTGCSAVPADGEGSFTGMTDDPVATGAGNNPVLSTLVSAVRTANLVDTLNTAEDITVIALANPAFEAIPADQLQAVLADNVQLTAILTHHVIDGRLAPAELAGTHTTLGSDEVTIAGSGEDFTIDGTVTGTPASVICGNVQTANATVYIMDQVLAPAAS